MQSNAMINQFMFQLQSLFQFETYGGEASSEFHVFIGIMRQLGVLFTLQDFTFCVSEVERWRPI